MDFKLKGDLAEYIVRLLLMESGLDVYSMNESGSRGLFFRRLSEVCGKEYSNSQRSYLKRTNGVPVPDLVIMNKNGTYQLVEVKYRELNHFEKEKDRFEKELENIWNQWACKTIWVSKDKFPEFGHFAVVINGDLMTNERITEIRHWHIKGKILKQCEFMLKKIYS